LSTERTLLAAACDSRGAYALIKKHMLEEDWSDISKAVLSKIDDYYRRDPDATSVDTGVLTSMVVQDVHNPKHKTVFSDIVAYIAAENVSGVNVVAVVLGAKREALGNRIASMLASTNKDELPELMAEFQRLTESTSLPDRAQDTSELLVAPDIDEVTHGDEQDLIRLMPISLNRRLDGGVLRGHHVVVFARPEMGKTMFVINAVAGFLRQDMRVLYLGNEEPIQDTVLRIMSRLSEMTKHQIMEDKQTAYNLAVDKGYKNLYLMRLTPGTLREIEELVVQVRPDVLVVDQLRNIQVKDDSLTRSLEKAANGVRQIAGKYKCLALSVTQAGESASGKAVLTMGDVDSSNTGIPGACDVMIGIGATKEDEVSNRRVLSLAKNKRSGNHSFFPVSVNVPLAKISSMEV